MSGIVGMVAPDGRPASPALLRNMIDSIAHRGPDGTAVWAEGSVGLGHAAHCTTPESEAETWPLVLTEPPAVIVADARIDNRGALRRVLDPRPTADGVVTDAALIGAAYDRWGTDCATHLIGDFAFAIWDSRAHRLFCARDGVGTRPFYYAHAANGTFAFGSELKALAPVPSVSRTVNDDRVADFLLGINDAPSTTFYRDIRRLLPGQALEFTPHDLRVWTYWAPDPDRTIRLSSDEAYAEAFREHFDEAVRCRLRSNRSVGAYLSGGLDSSSIAVTARDLRETTNGGPLPTFSTVYDRYPSCDERPYIDAVLDQGGFAPHYILGDDVNARRSLEPLLSVHDEPFFAPNLAMNWTNAPHVRAAGVSVLLDGHGGDEVVSQGYGRFHELAQQSAWMALAREAWGASDGLPGSAFRLWGLYAWRYAGQPWMEEHPWAQRLYGWYSQGKQWVSGEGGTSSSIDQDPLQLLGPKLRGRGDVEARYRQALQDRKAASGSERTRHHGELTAPILGQSLELLDRTARAQGVEPRFPFLDRRLLSFCLALPAEQKRQRGWGRYVLRTALRDRLPRRVRRRRDKTDFTPHFVAALQKRESGAPLTDPRCGQKGYIKTSVLRDLSAAVEDLGPKASPQILFSLWRAIVVATWVQGSNEEASTDPLREKSTSEPHCEKFDHNHEPQTPKVS